MNQEPSTLAPWNDRDIAALLTLDEVAPGAYRSRHGDPNLNGRSYGGQLLGQAMMAASRTAPPGRTVSMMQMLFLQGAIPDQPIDFIVTSVQDGKRFASRHVTATQAASGRRILDAQVTFAVPLDAPAHQTPLSAQDDPRALPTLSQMPAEWEEKLNLLGGYSLREKPGMDFRVPDMHRQVAPGAGNATFRFWLKARDALPADAHMHAAALAYLSDWWLNFSAMNAHTGALQPGKGIYTSSLNHGLWLHRPVKADAWLHFDCHSPAAADGRGLAIARVHDEAGVLVASATQECLMGYTGSGPRVG
jgi:acyl-CoA thioesterase-2